MIVGLVTCYREGRLVAGAIDSLRKACDLVLVLEGPAPPDRPEVGSPSLLPARDRVIVRHGSYADDAAKRSELVQWAQRVHSKRYQHNDSLWLVWCDADELLLWPEYLPDYLDYLDGAERHNATGGFPLRHVEPDGSVHLSWGRVLNGLHVRRYVLGGYQVELTSGMVVALPLTPLCSAGGIPLAPEGSEPQHYAGTAGREMLDRWLAEARPPLQGEPHILHRHPLRESSRAAHRMKDDEAAAFETLAEIRRAAP